MKHIVDQYQSDPSRQPVSVQRHIRRGEALGRLLLRLSAYVRRLYRRGSEVHSRVDEQQAAAHSTPVLAVKPQEEKAAKAQEGRAQAANDEDYRSVA